MIRVLLIGMKEDEDFRKGFYRFTKAFRSCTTLEEAKKLLGGADLFFLDSKFGVDACRTFLSWVRKNTAAVGVIVEDKLNNDICIEAINSGIVCDYLLRPVTPEQYAETWTKYKEKLFYEKLYASEREKEEGSDTG